MKSAWCNQHERYEYVPEAGSVIRGTNIPHDPHHRSRDDQTRQWQDKAQIVGWAKR